MSASQPLPDLWLLSDARNDEKLEYALRSAGRRIALVYRHYHLTPAKRRARFEQLTAIARHCGHLVILSGDAAMAQRWRADGWYSPPRKLRPRSAGLIGIATAHDLSEIGMANQLGADAIMLSPVFPTRSHPGARTLGPTRFRLLASRARSPVIALGGMTRRKARRLAWARWAAVDGLSPQK